jgi:hypothetical protein
MKIREILFKGLTLGCTDGGCVVTGPKTGMHTNGGCHCLQNLNRTQLGLLQSRIKVIGDIDIELPKGI